MSEPGELTCNSACPVIQNIDFLSVDSSSLFFRKLSSLHHRKYRNLIHVDDSCGSKLEVHAVHHRILGVLMMLLQRTRWMRVSKINEFKTVSCAALNSCNSTKNLKYSYARFTALQSHEHVCVVGSLVRQFTIRVNKMRSAYWIAVSHPLLQMRLMRPPNRWMSNCRWCLQPRIVSCIPFLYVSTRVRVFAPFISSRESIRFHKIDPPLIGAHSNSVNMQIARQHFATVCSQRYIPFCVANIIIIIIVGSEALTIHNFIYGKSKDVYLSSSPSSSSTSLL